MHDYRKSVKFTLYLTYAAMAITALITVFMPLAVQWFVEIRGKDPNLATSIMITCYPCMPFAAVMLYSLRKLLLNMLDGLVLGDANVRLLRTISICCLGASVIMILGGFRYMPFYISGFAAAAGALVVCVIKNVFDCALQMQREEEFESVRKHYEKDSNIGNR